MSNIYNTGNTLDSYIFKLKPTPIPSSFDLFRQKYWPIEIIVLILVFILAIVISVKYLLPGTAKYLGGLVREFKSGFKGSRGTRYENLLDNKTIRIILYLIGGLFILIALLYISLY